jgi:hypothetical protein
MWVPQVSWVKLSGNSAKVQCSHCFVLIRCATVILCRVTFYSTKSLIIKQVLWTLQYNQEAEVTLELLPLEYRTHWMKILFLSQDQYSWFKNKSQKLGKDKIFQKWYKISKYHKKLKRISSEIVKSLLEA